MAKSKFEYCGTVRQFGQILTGNWKGTTWAPTEAKALSNLAYQYKYQHGFSPGTKILLNPLCLREVSRIEEKDDYEYYDEGMRRMINESIQM